MPDMPRVLVWDLDTIPDISGFAAAHDLSGRTVELPMKSVKAINSEAHLPLNYLHRRVDRASAR